MSADDSPVDRPGPQPAIRLRAELPRRVRAWPMSSWRHRSRIEDVRSTLAELAVLAGESDSLTRPAVPDAGPHALADQLEVLARDAEQAGAGPDQIEQIFAALSARLGLNR